jgi:radical SAM protein with 4Fe4S-binding SPASM domain
VLAKFFNILKLTFSYFISIIVGRPIHFGLPLGISIEPTNNCNLKCKECPTGMDILQRPKGSIDKVLAEKVLQELSSKLTTVIFYFQGEPFINREVDELISYASGKKVYSITSTNGHYFTNENIEKIIKSGLNKLIISVDGTTQSVYETYRVGGRLEKVIEGVKLLVSEKQKANSKLPKLVLQFLVTAENEHQINDAKKLANDLKVDAISFKTAQIYDFEGGNPLIPVIEKYSRYKKQQDGTYKIKSKLKNRCWRMWGQPVVTATGDVVPCCFDKDANYKMGNLNEQHFKEIWQSENYKNFRKKVFDDRKSIDICQNCTEGLFNTRFKG